MVRGRSAGFPSKLLGIGSNRAHRPRVVENRAELENPSSCEVEAIELLTLLVERYEEEHCSVAPG